MADLTYLDKLERELDVVLAKVDAVLADRGDGDDEDTEDTWSASADGAASGNNCDLDDDDDADSEPDAGDDDDAGVAKASLTYAQSENNPTHRPGASALTAHPSGGVALTPATRAASPHKFDALISHVMDRDSCTRSEAMSRARQEYPDTFQSYQDFQAASPTTEQYSRNLIGKSAPQTFEGLVGEQMRKGVTEEIAKVRVINQYGSTALRDRAFAKRVGDDVADQFHKRAEDLWSDSNLDRCEALRAARKAHPSLYRALRR